MKFFALIPFVFAAAAAEAFDSVEWLAKRDYFIHEAQRMRAAYSNCVAKLEAPAENVSVPLETYPNGAVKVLVKAKRAQYFFDSGLVWAEGVEIRRFGPDGAPDGQIDAQSCVVDRVAKCGWAEGPAKIRHGSSEFGGRGVFFSTPESYVRVEEGSDIRSEDLKFGGLKP